MPVLDYADDTNRRRLWSWQARIGFAPKAGTRPIGWYQAEHAKLSDTLERLADRALGSPPGFFGDFVEVRQRANWIEFRYPSANRLRRWRPLVEAGQLQRLLRKE